MIHLLQQYLNNSVIKRQAAGICFPDPSQVWLCFIALVYLLFSFSVSLKRHTQEGQARYLSIQTQYKLVCVEGEQRQDLGFVTKYETLVLVGDIAHLSVQFKEVPLPSIAR